MDFFVELNNLFSKHRFYPKKGSGMHFVVKKQVLSEVLVLSELNKSDKVLEVNAGEFFIARKLSETTAFLTAFEERKELVLMLEKELPKINLMPFSFASFSKKIDANKCVSFLPSGSSGEIFLKLLLTDFDLMVLLLQKDFAEKILALPGFSEYGFLSVLADCFFEVKEVIQVKPDSFFPPVSNDFFLIKFSGKKLAGIKNKKDFSEFLKALFRFKNRVFVSALTKAIPLMNLDQKTKNKMEERLKEIEFNEKVYLMESQDFIELFVLLTK
ncbi:MAG: rRNA adenine N-6-methyltransferase family protein [archaeon]